MHVHVMPPVIESVESASANMGVMLSPTGVNDDGILDTSAAPEFTPYTVLRDHNQTVYYYRWAEQASG